MTLTVDDRELIELAQQRDDEMCHELADRLQSLLSDRDKLEQLLERVWACRMEAGEGRFINLAKLRPVIKDIGAALTQTEVP